MKNNNKIVVLTDLKKSSINNLKNTVALAKMIKCEVHVFHVKKSIDLVKKDNNLSALRSINDHYKETENKLKGLKSLISNQFNFSIDYSFSIGNVNKEIETFLDQTNPDIIVLGKKKKNVFRLIGDNVTEMVLKKHQGAILIADKENNIEPNKELAIGLLNDIEEQLDVKFPSELVKFTKSPLKSFHISDSYSNKTETLKEKKTINYVFEKSDDSIKTLSKYLAKNSINLLCVDRATNGKKKSSVRNYKELIKELPVNLLILGNKNYNLN